LLIDDNRDFHDELLRALAPRGYLVEWWPSAEDDAGERGPAAVCAFDVLLLDNRLPGKKGIEFLEELRQQGVQTPAILITEHYNPNLEIDARKLGVCDFIFKPPPSPDGRSLDPLLGALWKAAEAARLMKERVILPADPGTEGTRLVSAPDSVMSDVYNLVARAAREAGRDKPVLITGEAGTGKDVIARALFQASRRKAGPLLKVPCADRNEKELEEELFGYRGSDRTRGGAFEKAHGGALLLDDLDRASRSVQAKVRRANADGLVICGGTGGETPVDVWVIACAHRDFDPECHFRFRRIPLPRLQDRGAADVDLLADHFLRQAAASESKPWLTGFSEPARVALRRHHWPGNVAEMREVVLRAVCLCEGVCEVTPQDLKLTPRDTLSAEIRAHLQRAIQEAAHSGQADLSCLLGFLKEELVYHVRKQTSVNPEVIAAHTGLAVSDVQQILGDRAGGSAPAPPKRDLPLSRQKVWRAYQDALLVNPSLVGEPDVRLFEWLRAQPGGLEGLPKKFGTFQRYLTAARTYYGCPKNTPTSDRPGGKSIVRPDQL
jgi:DNA-binding NtrC family response regulator